MGFCLKMNGQISEVICKIIVKSSLSYGMMDRKEIEFLEQNIIAEIICLELYQNEKRYCPPSSYNNKCSGSNKEQILNRKI